jgi:hypothetical protein
LTVYFPALCKLLVMQKKSTGSRILFLLSAEPVIRKCSTLQYMALLQDNVDARDVCVCVCVYIYIVFFFFFFFFFFF